MAVEEPEQFSDPSLKACLRRALSEEKAPPDLRQRITGVFARDRARRVFWRRVSAFAAAAAILIATGGLTWRLAFPHHKHTSARKVVVKGQLAQSLVKTHDCCCKDHPQHHSVSAPIGDFRQIGIELSRSLGHPVLAADLSDDGWIFRGASMCPVGGCKSAHLLYQKNQATLSVFSVKAEDACEAACEFEEAGYPLAGFVKDQGMYCIVAHCQRGRITQADVNELLHKHEQALISPPATVAVAR